MNGSQYERKGHEYKTDGKGVWCRRALEDGPWQKLSNNQLLDLGPVDSPIWRWLREQGIRRPPRSGGNPATSVWRSTPAAQRRQKPVTIMLSDSARAKLNAMALAEGTSMSAMVERLIVQAPIPTNSGQQKAKGP